MRETLFPELLYSFCHGAQAQGKLYASIIFILHLQV
jgi:hypothetical protein